MGTPRIGRGALLLAALLLVAVPSVSQADDAAPTSPAPALAPLLSRLAHHAEQFEQMKRRGSFTLSGRMEELDGDGHVNRTKEMVLRSTATPRERLTEILKYAENGADKTAEARKKASSNRAEKKTDKDKKKDDLRLPFLATEQARYSFSIGERDAQTSQVRIVFKPLVAAEDSYKGSAWVDETAGEILTLAFSPSKNPTFVDHVEVTLRFDLSTPLGRAPSSIAFDARGGFLVVHKHYRGNATITDPRIAF